MTSNAHDKLFKDAFWHPPAAAQLVKATLPAEFVKHVDWPSMKRIAGELLTSKMKESRCDAVFEVPFVVEKVRTRLFIHIHVEHQSKNDPTMLFRCLDYTAGLLRAYVDKMGSSALQEPPPIVVPIVVSHDPEGWTAHQSLDAFYEFDPETERLTRGIRPQFKYFVDDLSRHEDDALRARAMDRYRYLVLFALRDGRKMRILELFEKQLQAIAELSSAPGGGTYMSRVLWYLFEVSTNSQITPSNLAEVAAKAGPVADRVARERVEAWQKGLRDEGREIGREEGREIGREEGREIGREEGREIGREEAQKEARASRALFVMNLIERKLGPVDDELRESLEQASNEVLERVVEGVVYGKSIEELREALNETL